MSLKNSISSESAVCSHGRNAHAATGRAGYTLVEIAFASFVVGVAFLALVGLGRLALRNAADAENDTRSAMLAEDIFATLRSAADSLCATGGAAAWASFWSGFAVDDGVGVEFQTVSEKSCMRYADLSGEADGAPVLYGDGRTVRLAVQGRDNGDGAVPQWTAQFSLTASPTNVFYGVFGSDAQAFEYISGPVSNLTMVSLSLHVWPNAYDRRERSRSFFTHIPFKGLTHGQPVQ